MTKAHPDFQGLTRMQMRDIYHALQTGPSTVRQMARKYGVTERTVMGVWREVRRSIGARKAAA